MLVLIYFNWFKVKLSVEYYYINYIWYILGYIYNISVYIFFKFLCSINGYKKIMCGM